MNMVLGVALVWIGGAMLFMATHTPDGLDQWGMYQALIARMRGQVA